MAEPRLVLFGCKNTTTFLLDALLEQTDVHAVVTIDPAEAARAQVADYRDMREVCSERGVRCYVTSRYTLKDDGDQAAIEAMAPTVGLAIGWQRLIPAPVLSSFRIGVFGMHGSADDLPRGRGRSPMNWALLERRGQFHTNLFRYDPGVDSGDIVDSHTFSIRPSDTAETMHLKNVMAMKRLVLRNLDGLMTGRLQLTKQEAGQATYYPKREPSDSIVDWRLDVEAIDAHIRAVAPPFNGAFTMLNGREVTITRAAILETDLIDHGYKDRAPGEVVEMFPGGKFVVRCRGGLLLIHEHTADPAPVRGELLVSPPERIRAFPTNEHGTHDLPG